MRNLILLWLVVLVIVFNISCSPTPFNRKYHRVSRIIDGNTLEVRSKVYIKLIGIKNTKASKDYLIENVLNHKIRIKYDSKDVRKRVKRGSTIYAYLVTDKRVSVNGQILKKRLSPIDDFKLSDSLLTFNVYADKDFKNDSKEIDLVPNNNPLTNDSPRESTLPELAQNTSPAVFVIYSYNNEKQYSQGTGFFVSRNGIGISNYHVFSGGLQHYILTYEGNTYEVEKILYENKESDFIIFKIRNNNTFFPYLRTKTTNITVGEDIFVIGNPKGLGNTLSTGIISAIRSEVSTNDIIQTNAAVSHGSSGSPLCNMRGEVIGVVVSKIEDCENCNFAINIDVIKPYLNNVLKN